MSTPPRHPKTSSRSVISCRRVKIFDLRTWISQASSRRSLSREGFDLSDCFSDMSSPEQIVAMTGAAGGTTESPVTGEKFGLEVTELSFGVRSALVRKPLSGRRCSRREW